MVMLLASYLIIQVLLDLISSHLFNLNLKDHWIGIFSICVAFLITYSYLRRRRKTEPAAQKRNWRWASNAIALGFLVFVGFIGFRIYQNSLSLPQMQHYLPATTETAVDSTASDSIPMDSAEAIPVIDSL